MTKKKLEPLIGHVTRGNIFEDLERSPAEARRLTILADLMITLEKYIRDNQLSQEEAAKLLRVSQPRISNLLNGKINLFTIDMLVKMLARANIKVSLVTKTMVQLKQANKPLKFRTNKATNEFVRAKMQYKLTSGEMLKFLRGLQKMSQRDLAKKTKIPQSEISALEKDTKQMERDTAILLAKALRVHPAVLLFSDFDMSQVA